MSAPSHDPLSKRRDVRMRGFAQRSTVEQAQAWIDRSAARLDVESIPLEHASGRILCDDVTSAVDVPPFDRAAMDGYALRGEDTQGAGDYNPLSLRIVGEAFPGRPFAGSVEPGSAVRIMTGAPLPAGCDAVVPAEYTTDHGETVEVTTAVSPAKHVGHRGEDVRTGDGVLPAGRRLRPQDLGVLASVGVAIVKVVRRPRVRLITTGNELAAPGSPRGPHQIFDANTPMLAALVERDSGVLESKQHVRDDRAAVREAMTATGADVILISGGSSVGAEDHAPSILAEVGELAIHGIAMRPSSPAGMGRIGGTVVFLLPGNPVSCLCAYDFFAGRAIRLLGGGSADWPYALRSERLTRKVVSAVGRLDYCRVRRVDGGIEPLAVSGASVLSSTTRADGFVLVPAASEGFPAGAEVTVYLYDALA